MPEYRVSPLVSAGPAIYEGDRSIVFERATDRHQFELSSTVLVSICEAARSWTPESELRSAIEAYGLGPEESARVLSDLHQHGLLVEREQSDRQAVEDDPFRWSPAGYYDRYVRDWPFLDYSEDDVASRVSERLDSYTQSEDPPDMTKTYPDAEGVALPAEPDHDRLAITQTAPASETDVDTAYSLPDADGLGSFTDARSATGGPPGGSLDRESLGKLLLYSFGRIGTIDNDDIPHGPLVLKTSPGHGGLHPTEVYPILVGVDGIRDGVYHYSVRDHELERLDDVPDSTDLVASSGPTARFALTAVVERCMWKYRTARELRNILHDVGHLIGTYHFVASALGLRAGVEQKHRPESVAEILDVDLFSEPPVGLLTAEAPERED